MTNITGNLNQFKAELPENVTLIAVSKTKPLEMLEEAYDAGQRDFGENKIQEMSDKHSQLPKDIRWHMIGHVQGNKIKQMAPFVHLVHGMDKPKRLAELNKEALKNNRVIDCLIQVHIAEEETKFGFSYDEAESTLLDNPEGKYSNIRIKGLMGMATNTQDEQKVRTEFKGLNAFFLKMKKSLSVNSGFDTLSIGMSGDYSLAIEEGATMIRVGSSIFGTRN